MDTSLFTSLFLNLALAAFLFMFMKWFIKYDMAWWLRVQRSKTAFSTVNKFSFLKIKIPRDVFKTPLAMEVVLLTLNQSLGHRNMPTIPPIKFTPFYEMNGGKKKFSLRFFTYYKNGGKEACRQYKWVQELRSNFFFKYISGALRSWSSLEIVSDAGEIYFLVVTKANNAEIFKQYAYSQFPGLEITDLDEDPLNKFTYTNQKTGKSQIYVGRYATKRGEDHIPIKTYVDYGLDKDMVKDEFKIDPLVVLLESMSQAKKGEMYWFQILIRPTIYDSVEIHHYDWKKATQDKINQILGYKDGEDQEVDDGHGGMKKIKGTAKMERSLLSLTPSEKHLVEIMQKNLEKPGFDCIVKMFYWVDIEINPKGLDLPRGIMTVVNATKPFTKQGYGSLNFDTITTDGDTPFLDPTGVFTEGRRAWTWKMAKLRAGYYQEIPGAEFFWRFFKIIVKRYWETGNWDATFGLRNEIREYWLYPGIFPHYSGDGFDHGHGFVLNLEELTTLWHFPGKAFGNTESKVAAVKSDPPSNLPI